MKQDIDRKIEEATYGKDEPEICKTCLHRAGCDGKDLVCFNKCDTWRQKPDIMKVVSDIVKGKKM